MLKRKIDRYLEEQKISFDKIKGAHQVGKIASIS